MNGAEKRLSSSATIDAPLQYLSMLTGYMRRRIWTIVIVAEW